MTSIRYIDISYHLVYVQHYRMVIHSTQLLQDPGLDSYFPTLNWTTTTTMKVLRSLQSYRRSFKVLSHFTLTVLQIF